MDSIILSIVLFIAGSIAYTGISYVAKYLKDPTTQFNWLYFLTSLLSMFLVILIAPAFLLPGILPFAVSGNSGTMYIVLASFSMGLAGNFLLNLPLSYLLKQLSNAGVTSLTTVAPKAKYVIYLIATVALIGLIVGASVYAVVQYERSITTSGTIETVGVNIYSDAGLGNELTTINWGLREPGSVVNQVLYIQNTGNSEVVLNFYTSDWQPSATQDYMNLSWDYGGETLAPNQAIQVTLTLTVSPQISGITNFSFDITVVAS